MGQRLVITVHAFDEDIATIYYHWSAYTTSALDEAQKILKNVKWEDTTSKDELILRIVRFMESNGGCIDFEDKPEFKINPGEFSFDDLTYMIKTFTDGYSYHRYRGEIWESIDG